MAGTESAAYDTGQLQVIEWHMMDKRKFYPLSVTCSIVVRGFLYPLTVVKTRLQVQRQHSMYTGTFDAFRKIFQTEGIPGLYKGYWINTFQVVSGILYVTTYENIRHFLSNYTSIQDSKTRALFGGGCASLVGQTFIVPCDVVSQHMMVLGNLKAKHAHGVVSITDPLRIAAKVEAQNLGVANRYFLKPLLAPTVISEIYRRDGLIGFYRGYVASVLCFVPNSALFWSFYMFYTEKYKELAPDWCSHLLIQMIAAPSSGITTTCMTNPLDLLRARLQIQRTNWYDTLETLWREEKLGIFTKGLSARLISSSLFSTFIITGYESLKRMSVHPDYKDKVIW